MNDFNDKFNSITDLGFPFKDFIDMLNEIIMQLKIELPARPNSISISDMEAKVFEISKNISILLSLKLLLKSATERCREIHIEMQNKAIVRAKEILISGIPIDDVPIRGGRSKLLQIKVDKEFSVYEYDNRYRTLKVLVSMVEDFVTFNISARRVVKGYLTRKEEDKGSLD